MSVRFVIETARGNKVVTRYALDDPNARDLLGWLGIDAGESLNGKVPGRDLAARCRSRLWDEPRNRDAGRPAVTVRKPGRCAVNPAGPRADYLRQKAADLLFVAGLAGDGSVLWN